MGVEDREKGGGGGEEAEGEREKGWWRDRDGGGGWRRRWGWGGAGWAERGGEGRLVEENPSPPPLPSLFPTPTHQKKKRIRGLLTSQLHVYAAITVQSVGAAPESDLTVHTHTHTHTNGVRERVLASLNVRLLPHRRCSCTDRKLENAMLPNREGRLVV